MSTPHDALVKALDTIRDAMNPLTEDEAIKAITSLTFGLRLHLMAQGMTKDQAHKVIVSYMDQIDVAPPTSKALN